MREVQGAVSGSNVHSLLVPHHGPESWTIKNAERQRIDAFELWCWRRLLRVPWRPPPTHTFSGDYWTPTGNSGTVSYGVTFPFSYVLLHNFLLCPPRVYFPVLCKFWQLHGGLMATSAEGLCHTLSGAPRVPVPVADHS